MRKFALLSVTALPLAFMSEICETVVIDGVRHNKADVDANPEKYGKVNNKASDADNAATTVTAGGTAPEVAPGVLPLPAPSAAVAVLGDKAVAPAVPSQGQLMVMKKGTATKPKFIVVNLDGSPVEDNDMIDKAGYGSETEAWAAITNYLHAEQMKLNPAGSGVSTDGPAAHQV